MTESATADKDDWMREAVKTIEIAAKFKAQMLKHGKRRAFTNCPRCGGKLHGSINGSINGSRNHIHMACETGDCPTRCME